MNKKAIYHYLGLLLRMEAILMLPPLALSAYYGAHGATKGFSATIATALLVGLLLRSKGVDRKKLFLRESFVIVAAGWIVLSLFGALPFWLSGEIPQPVDALFESVSGFTTTGASILENVEALSPGLLFWRSFTHWVGGMGVFVLLLAVAPFLAGDRGIGVMQAESPGPAPGKLVPQLRQSSKILYGIYFGLTLLLLILLLAGGMPLYDSVVNALATAGTGGFSVKNASIAAYDSLYAEVVITVFMILFGVNFNIYYFLLVRQWAGIRASDELKWYFGIILASTALITANLTGTVYETAGESLRRASFHVATLISSTGFGTADFSVWPELSKAVLFLLLFCGACGGSTGGGFKVSRVIILLREARRGFYQLTHPRAVEVVKLDGKVVAPQTVRTVNAYAALFIFWFGISVLLVSLDNFDFETTVTSVLTCLNNMGPGFGMVSPHGNFAAFSNGSKLVLMLGMLLGRLEIFPILLLFMPATWRKMN